MVDWYASPTGTVDGAGTELDPWDLDTALTERGVVDGGDTIFLRGGVYTSTPTTSTLVGIQGNPIIVRNYVGENPRIDCGDGNDFRYAGSDTRYQGLEIFSSLNESRTETTPSAPYRGVFFSSNPNGLRCEVVNCVVHDVSGVGFWAPVEDGIYYGNIIYNIGLILAAGTSGHSCYTQNAATSSDKLFRHNIFFNSMEWNFHAFATQGEVNNFLIDENAFFNAGAGEGVGYPRSGNSLVRDSGNPATNITYNGNISYNVLDGSSQPGVVRWGGAGASGNGPLAMSDNYIVGEWDWQATWQSITGSGTTVVGTVINSGNAPGAPITVIASDTGNKIHLFGNDYDSNLAYLHIFKWDGGAGDVPVDLSSVAGIGQTYSIAHVFDLSTPVTSGTYGGGTVPVPMASVVSPLPLGILPSGYVPVSMGPEFGSFVVTLGGAVAPGTGGIRMGLGDVTKMYVGGTEILQAYMGTNPLIEAGGFDWTPYETNMLVRYDMSTQAGVIGDVTSLVDQSPIGNNAVSSGATDPSWSASLLNGEGGVVFTGSQRYDSGPFHSGVPIVGTVPITMFVVATYQASSGTLYLCDTKSALCMYAARLSTNSNESHRGTSGAQDSGPIDYELPHIYSVRWGGAQNSSRYIDGVFQSSLNTGTNAVAEVRIGSRSTGGGSFIGNMHEFVYWDRIVTDAEYNEIGNHFSTKYGLSWTTVTQP